MPSSAASYTYTLRKSRRSGRASDNRLSDTSANGVRRLAGWAGGAWRRSAGGPGNCETRTKCWSTVLGVVFTAGDMDQADRLSAALAALRGVGADESLVDTAVRGG